MELPVKLKRLNAEISFAWLAIAQADDIVYCPWFPINTTKEGVTAETLSTNSSGMAVVTSLKDIPRNLEPHPWGWSSLVCEELKQAGFSFDAPDLDVVKTVNARDFAADLEEEFGLRPGYCFRITNNEELKKRIDQISKKHRHWILKARFGMSGRERMKGVGSNCDSALQNWAEKRLRQGGLLFLEPWLDIVEEVGIQIEIPKTGDPILEGVTQLFCNEQGAFLAARFDQTQERNNNWKHSIKIAHQAANRMQSMGYFGPLGIDAVKYQTDSVEILERPLLDINARYTMGRLSLGLQRHLHNGEQGYFTVQRNDSVIKNETSEIRTLSLSPQSLDGKPVEHRFVAVFGKSISKAAGRLLGIIN